MTEDATGLCRDCGGCLYESGHTCPEVEPETMQCDECGEKKYGDYGRWAPAPGYHRVMLVCHDCAEYVRTFPMKQEAIDARAQLIAPDPHDACKETIKAREREATDLRYRVRELEAKLAERNAERDEMESERNATIRILRGQKRILATENRGLRRHQEELQNATHYCCMHMRWETREGAEV